MAIYEPGDRVIVREDLDVTGGTRYYMIGGGSSSSDVAVTEMGEFAGKVCTIERIGLLGRYKICEDGGKWNWTDEMFSGMYDNPADIEIPACVDDLMCSGGYA